MKTKKKLDGARDNTYTKLIRSLLIKKPRKKFFSLFCSDNQILSLEIVFKKLEINWNSGETATSIIAIIKNFDKKMKKSNLRDIKFVNGIWH